MENFRSACFILLLLMPITINAQDVQTITPVLELFKTKYPEGFENLNVSALRYAGDINGDGLADFSLGNNSVNLSTESLYDLVQEYKIYFGSSESFTDPDVTLDFTHYNLDGLPGFNPIGDMNGDGCDDHVILSDKIFFDLSCGAFEDTLTFDPGVNFINRSYTIEVDINEDGFEDILFHHADEGYDRFLQFGILYGADTIDSIKYEEYEIKFEPVTDDIEGERLYREGSLTAGDIDNDGHVELLVFGYNSLSENEFTAHNPGDFLILERGDSTGFEVALAYNMPYQYNLGYQPLQEDSDIYFGEYKAGGFKEVFITDGVDTHILIEIGHMEEKFQVSEYVDLNEQNQVLSFIYPIGDFDQDGVLDLYTAPLNENTHKILFGGSELGVFTETELSHENRFISIINWNRDYLENTTNGYLGDMNSDGFDDFLMYSVELLEGETSPDINNTLGEGVLFQYGNSGRDLSQRHELFYQKTARQEPLSTFNVGDFNDDGMEDYGIIFKNSLTSEKNSRIEIFFGEQGKNNWEEADLIIKTEEGFEPSYPAVGDFNGDGISDLVVNYQDSVSGIHFYWGGTNPDSETDYFVSTKSIAGIETFGYNYIGFSILGNLSDINGDNIDDLGLSGLYYSFEGDRINSTYILFGGENISQTPNIELEGRVDNILGLGDIDIDGKNEFVIADIQNDNVKIYEGFNSSDGENFNENSDYVISENVLDFTIDVRGMGFNSEVGDFNGDGINDLVVAPRVSQDGSRVNRGRGIYEYNGGTMLFIFYGGDGFDTIADLEIKIPISSLRSRTGINLTENETEFINLFTGEINTIPSSDGDSFDEILVGTSTSDFLTNALILSGDSLKSKSILKANNLNLGLGSKLGGDFGWTYTNVKSAIGDFNADGKLDFILPQSGDPNFPEDPVYVYSLGVNVTSIQEPITNPVKFNLSQNYPNPFNPTTQINYSLINSGQISLKVYDITGRLVTTLVQGSQVSGNYKIQFDASNLSSGVYFYRLESESGILTKKMTLIK